MERPPRSPKENLLTARTLGKSAAQGLAVFAAAFGCYYASLAQCGAEGARSMGLAVLIFFKYAACTGELLGAGKRMAVYKTAGGDWVFWAAGGGPAHAACLYVYPAQRLSEALGPAAAPAAGRRRRPAAAATLWYELVKLYKRHKQD